MQKNIIQFKNKNKSVDTHTNKVGSDNSNLPKFKDLELELLVIEQQIHDYLERVEFYIEEPDVEYLSSLQDRRLVIKKQLLLAKPSLNDLYSLVEKVDNLEKVVLGLTTKTKHNDRNVGTKGLDPKQIGEINTKINLVSTQLLSVQASLKKERNARTKLISYLSKEDTCLYRTIYELSKRGTVVDTNNTKHDVLDWVEQQVTKNPNWGLKTICTNSEDYKDNESLTDTEEV